MTLSVNSSPRISLGHLPTPIERLSNLTKFLGGPEIWLKRDDCTGLAFGGNKTRKLEYLLADAQRDNADVIVTFGALQSNHVRQTIAACTKLNLDCHAILTDIVPHQEPAYRLSGNLLIDRLSNAHLHIVTTTDAAGEKAKELKATFKKENKNAYIIPAGGSSPVGVLGYVSAAHEIGQQARKLDVGFDAILSASATGGTQSGLTIGYRQVSQRTRIIGINIYDRDGPRFEDRLNAFFENVCQTLDIEDQPELEFVQGFVGHGYGVPTKAMKEAVATVFRLEGILLDPVYTGKAMAALFHLCRSGKFGKMDKILFVHTGGAPGLFAYQDALLQPHQSRN